LIYFSFSSLSFFSLQDILGALIFNTKDEIGITEPDPVKVGEVGSIIGTVTLHIKIYISKKIAYISR
jgi:hypothetical protein